MRRRKQTALQGFLDSRLYLMVIWLLMAFALITLIIMFPYKGWLAYVDDNHLGGATEMIGNVLLILIGVVVAFYISWKLYEWHSRKKGLAVTIASISVPLVLAIGASMLLISSSANEKAENSDLQPVQPSGVETKKPLQRTFEIIKSLERGDIYRLGDSIYMSPYPTEEELDYFFVKGKWKTVVCLLDSKVKENRHFIDYEKKELQKTEVQFTQISLNPKDNEKQIEVVVKACLNLPKPLLIHSWFTDRPDNIILRKIFFKTTNKSFVNLATNVSETY